MHIIKRYYLLIALFLSCCIPLITFTTYVAAEESDLLTTTQELISGKSMQQTATINFIPIVLWSIYALGVIYFGFIFIKNLNHIIKTIRNNAKVKELNFTNVLLDKLIIPHTFLSYIFLNKEAFAKQSIPKEVLWHEQIHAKQKHSIDILIIEFFQVVLWFHPLVYIIKRNIKLNHEFLADEGVLNKGVSTANYQELLLTFSSNVQQHQLANAINYSSIKKRFTVMKTQTSKPMVWLKVFVIIPLAAIVLYSFSDTVTVVENEKISSLDAIDINYHEATPLTYYNTPLKEVYYENVIFQFKNKQGIIIKKSFKELTEQEKKNLPSPPGVPTKRSPSKKNMQNWLDASQFGVWIDGKRIENALLTSYKSSDFDLYTVSKLAKNAVNYGKHYYQVGLSTKANYAARYAKGIQPLPKGAIVTIDYSKKNEIITQEKATPKMVAEYNRLAKKFNALIDKKGFKKGAIIRKAEVDRIEYIYALMTNTQKENAEPFPNIPPPPPPPPPAPKAPKAPKVAKTPKTPKTTKVPQPPTPVSANGKEKRLPPPPPPASLTKFLKGLKGETNLYYFNDEKKSYAQIIEIAEKRKGMKTHMITNKDEEGKYVVKLYDKPFK